MRSVTEINFIRPTLTAALIVMAFATCSSTPKPGVYHAMTFPGASAEVKPLWSKKMSGFITDLDISRDGKRLLVGLIPDPESTGRSQHLVTALTIAGKTIWKLPLENQLREQTFSDDGMFAVISN